MKCFQRLQETVNGVFSSRVFKPDGGNVRKQWKGREILTYAIAVRNEPFLGLIIREGLTFYLLDVLN